MALQDLHSLCCPAKSTLHNLIRERPCLAKQCKSDFPTIIPRVCGQFLHNTVQKGWLMRARTCRGQTEASAALKSAPCQNLMVRPDQLMR